MSDLFVIVSEIGMSTQYVGYQDNGGYPYLTDIWSAHKFSSAAEAHRASLEGSDYLKTPGAKISVNRIKDIIFQDCTEELLQARRDELSYMVQCLSSTDKKFLREIL